MNPVRLSARERQVYRRYAELALPRHTSYPISPVWSPHYGPGAFRQSLRESAEQGRPLSLYVHIPFCERLCYFCACTREIVPAAKRREHDPSAELLRGLEIEAAMVSELAGPRAVRQVHLGGGSPTFLHPEQLAQLHAILKRYFRLAPEAEVAVEIDPRITTREHLQTLRSLGFNRVSLGVQDFAAVVQRAVNRVQPFETVERVVAWCRELSFASLNFDLIYGLPFQTPETMTDTLAKVLILAPDRIAFYRLAVIPEMFRWQNTFHEEDLPAGELPLELNLLASSVFQSAGYEFIGLDHFAKPGESLARALREGSLQRNFQGMTTGKSLDLLGLGPSSISQLDGAFAQNCKTTAEWRQRVTEDLATARGLRLTTDDRLRRELMQQLYGRGVIEKRALEQQFGIAFDEYFALELLRLDGLADDGLLAVRPDRVALTAPLGRLLVRVVAAAFDAYLPPDAYREGLPPQFASRVG